MILYAPTLSPVKSWRKQKARVVCGSSALAKREGAPPMGPTRATAAKFLIIQFQPLWMDIPHQLLPGSILISPVNSYTGKEVYWQPTCLFSLEVLIFKKSNFKEPLQEPLADVNQDLSLMLPDELTKSTYCKAKPSSSLRWPSANPLEATTARTSLVTFRAQHILEVTEKSKIMMWNLCSLPTLFLTLTQSPQRNTRQQN